MANLPNFLVLPNEQVTDSNGRATVSFAAKLQQFMRPKIGTVTQGTSRTTAVALDARAGQITLVSAAGSTTYASFTVNNAMVSADDFVQVVQKSGTDAYRLSVTNISNGSFTITFATTSGTTTEQPVFAFRVHKGIA